MQRRVGEEEGGRWIQQGEQARRGSISRLGFYTLEEHSRPPAGSFKGQGVLPPRRGCVATEGVLPPVFPRAEGKGSRATHQGGGGGPRLVPLPPALGQLPPFEEKPPPYEEKAETANSSGSAKSPSPPLSPSQSLRGTVVSPPDLLQLSVRYEQLRQQTLTRAPSSSRMTGLPRPATGSSHLRPHKLEPLSRLQIPAQSRGLTALHLSCNYSGQSWSHHSQDQKEEPWINHLLVKGEKVWEDDAGEEERLLGR